ncbi:MAG: hypothetical protein JWO13_2160 [Acidobacteriales bacterium]|nr:hypothetical protein [Terriglobales bacterium]
MENYYKNKFCPCMRCRMNCMMGPAMLVTVGVLWLLHNLHVTRDLTFLAVILIVIGGVKLLQSSASTDGHIQPTFAYPDMPAAPPPPAPPTQAPGQVNNG